MIILIGGQKGGTGKTTLSTNMSILRASLGKDVLLTETDNQGSAIYWYGTREESNLPIKISFTQIFGKGFTSQIKDFSRRFDDLIIDAAGRDSFELREALTLADIFIIPVTPSQYDIWTLGLMDNLVDKALTYNPKLKAYVVLNRVPTNPNMKEEDDSRNAVLGLENIKLANNIIRDRVIFRKVVPLGKGIMELNPFDNKAIQELKDLHNEIIGVN
ncbi:MAG: hypothetical protein LEGION0398_MBIBDBAK_00251 [Legionellaceae bacterium]